MDVLPSSLWSKILTNASFTDFYAFRAVCKGALTMRHDMDADLLCWLKAHHDQIIQEIHTRFYIFRLPQPVCANTPIRFRPRVLDVKLGMSRDETSQASHSYMLTLFGHHERLYDVHISKRCKRIKLMVDMVPIVDLDYTQLALMCACNEDLEHTRMDTKGFIRLGAAWGYYPLQAKTTYVQTWFDEDVGDGSRDLRVWVLDPQLPDPIEEVCVSTRHIQQGFRFRDSVHFNTISGVAHSLILKHTGGPVPMIFNVEGVAVEAGKLATDARVLDNVVEDGVYVLAFEKPIVLPARVTWYPVEANVQVFFEVPNMISNTTLQSWRFMIL